MMRTTPVASSTIVIRFKTLEMTFETPAAISSTPMKKTTDPK
jgi:hypothetical protein